MRPKTYLIPHFIGHPPMWVFDCDIEIHPSSLHLTPTPPNPNYLINRKAVIRCRLLRNTMVVFHCDIVICVFTLYLILTPPQPSHPYLPPIIPPHPYVPPIIPTHPPTPRLLWWDVACLEIKWRYLTAPLWYAYSPCTWCLPSVNTSSAELDWWLCCVCGGSQRSWMVYSLLEGLIV